MTSFTVLPLAVCMWPGLIIAKGLHCPEIALENLITEESVFEEERDYPGSELYVLRASVAG